MVRILAIASALIGLGPAANAADLAACPSCESIPGCLEGIDKQPKDRSGHRCREELALRLGTLYLDSGQRDKAVELYEAEAGRGNLAAADRLKSLGAAYSMPWSPFKLTIYPSEGWDVPHKPAVYGLDFGPLAAENPLTAGVQLGGFGALADRVYGAQFALGISHAKTVSGLQAAWFVSLADRVSGLQLSAIANIQKESSWGVQLGGANSAAELKGVQIGLYNDCDSLHGVQLGLLNRVRGSKGLKWLPILRISP